MGQLVCDNSRLVFVSYCQCKLCILDILKIASIMPSPEPRLRVRAYLWFDRWFQRWVRLLGILHEAFWLGCLDSEDLTAITIRNYQQSHMYNSAEHNLSGLFPWERDTIDRFFPPSSRILVAASGGGRELIALRGLGFEADGFDCAPRLIETSRRLLEELGFPSKVMLSPPSVVPTELMPHDGLIVGWTAYMHIFGSDRRIAFLRALRTPVAPGAPILVSFWVRDEGSHDEGRVLRFAKWCRSLRGRRSESLGLGDHLSNRGYFHRFAKAEVESELKASGFRMCHYSQEGCPHAVGIAE
jgi:hypothetical protein